MTAFVLKIVATFAMLLDHTCAVFPTVFPFFFRYIGRIAFPVYAYMIAQGCKHTRNINKYLLRLGIFAIVSEIPFDLAFRGEINFIKDTNIFYTLFLGAACITVYRKLNEKLLAPKEESAPDRRHKLIPITLSVLCMIPIALLGNLLSTDYGTPGVVYIVIFYFMKPEHRLLRTVAAFGIVFYMYGYPIVQSMSGSYGGIINALGSFSEAIMIVSIHRIYFFLFALISVLLICIYNDKLGPKLKWLFYAFYPAHLAILAAVKHLID